MLICWHRCVLSVCCQIHPEVMESALSADMLAQMCLVCLPSDPHCVLSFCCQIHPEVMESALSADMLATDLAYYLVRKGVSQNSLPCHFFTFWSELMLVSVLDFRAMSVGIACIQHQRDCTAPVFSHMHQHLCAH